MFRHDGVNNLLRDVLFVCARTVGQCALAWFHW